MSKGHRNHTTHKANATYEKKLIFIFITIEINLKKKYFVIDDLALKFFIHQAVQKKTKNMIKGITLSKGHFSFFRFFSKILNSSEKR